MAFRSAIDGLDKVIRSEIVPPKVILVTGPPGSMKTSFCYTLMSRYLKDTGEFGLYTTLEETVQSHLRNMEYRGWAEPKPRERRVPRRWDRHARPGLLPREARQVAPGREDALRRALHGETRDRDPQRWHHRDGSDLRTRREFMISDQPPMSWRLGEIHAPCRRAP